MMVERAAQDYSKLLQSVSLEKEINPICMNIEDMLTRLEELESLLVNVKCVNNVTMDDYANSILSFTPQFNDLKERIDKLEQFVEIVNKNVDETEKSLDIAEQELNVTDYSLKGLILKPLLAKTLPAATSGVTTNAEEVITPSNLNKDGEFQQVSIFKTTDYFGHTESETSTP